MKIVKFKNGKYAIRRGFIFWYDYQDLKNAVWWPKCNMFYSNCEGTLEEVTKVYNELIDKGEEVK